MSYMTKPNQHAIEHFVDQDHNLELVFEAKEMLFGGQEVILAGGTDLSRYSLEHHISYDLDLFVDGRFPFVPIIWLPRRSKYL